LRLDPKLQVQGTLGYGFFDAALGYAKTKSSEKLLIESMDFLKFGKKEFLLGLVLREAEVRFETLANRC
jgi:hypothetical protein